MRVKKLGYVIVVLALIALQGGCKEGSSSQTRTIRLATTTSTENSGLLDVLLPAFQNDTGIEVHVMSMGTGKALRTARDGNCDVVLVHDPKAEAKFVAEGFGANRQKVMYNDFVILGPASDPAGVKGMKSAAEAMAKIAAAKSIFISRGDNSGTHNKEMVLWQAAGLEPSGRWFRSVGRGMGDTLEMADQMKACVLVDRATFIKFRRKIDLVVLVDGDKRLHNPYGVIAVSPTKHPHVSYNDAARFIDFLTCDKGRKIIGDYRLQGEILFHPWPKRGEQPAGGKGEGGL
jgi:tungstate transport system substrate-binding protein